MSFEVDRPIQLLGNNSSELIKNDINHALANNGISTTDLTNETHAASPTYSIASSSLSSGHGGGMVASTSTTPTTSSNSNSNSNTIYSVNSNKVSSITRLEDSQNNFTSYHSSNNITNTSAMTTSPLPTYENTHRITRGDNNNSYNNNNNKHLLSPVPDSLDGKNATATVAAATAAVVVNSGGEPPARVPLPTPPASDGTPPHRQWHDSIPRPPTHVASMGVRSLPYSTSPVNNTIPSSWHHQHIVPTSSTATTPSSSIIAPSVSSSIGETGTYPGSGFVSSFSGSNSIIPTSHQQDAMYHQLMQQQSSGLLPPPTQQQQQQQQHTDWMNQHHPLPSSLSHPHHSHHDPYRQQQQQQQHHYYNDPVAHQHPHSQGATTVSSNYHQHFEPPPPQPTSSRRSTPYHPYSYSDNTSITHFQQQQPQPQHRRHHQHSSENQQQKTPQQRPSLSTSSTESSSSNTSSNSTKNFTNTHHGNGNGIDPGKVVTTTPRRYKCTVCVKRFTRPSSLATHMHSHTGEKPYKCQIEGCGRRFSVVSNLRRHSKIHNNTNNNNNSNNNELTRNSLTNIKSTS